MISKSPAGDTSPTTAATLLVPMSRPTIFFVCSFATVYAAPTGRSPGFSRCSFQRTATPVS